jgi:RimJ/RimL family protein N-acetyltransferase
MEEVVKIAGLNVIGLHVFGYNTGARAMYEKLGFEVTDVMMRKWL